MLTAVGARVEELSLALVPMVHRFIDVHTLLANGAMEEVFLATGLAGAALVAMEVLLLEVVVEDAALAAEVLAKLDLAVPAELSRRLHLETVVAFDLHHLGRVKLMRNPVVLRLDCERRLHVLGISVIVLFIAQVYAQEA